MKFQYKLILVFIIPFLVLTCTEEAEPVNAASNRRDQFVSNIALNNISPTISIFNEVVEQLDVLIESYFYSSDLDTLIAICDQWKIAAVTYESVYAFNIGEVRDQYLHLALNNWPCQSSSFEYVINSDDVLDFEYIQNMGSKIKSLSTLEYLLFNDSVENTHEMFQISSRRLLYLKLISNELHLNAVRLSSVWSSLGEGRYLDIFIRNEGSGINESFNLFFNGIYNMIDTAKVTKVGKPSGLENSKIKIPETVQAYYSEFSLELIKTDIAILRDVYFSDSGFGISDLVKAIHTDNSINNDILNTLNQIDHTLANFQFSLSESIVQNDPEIETLHKQLETLSILLSVDLRSILSVIITSTDNDGD